MCHPFPLFVGLFFVQVSGETCTFKDPPKTSWVWDRACRPGDLGCNADGIHLECRFCGEEPFDACQKQCTFKDPPMTSWVWDPDCRHGDLGCNADGSHVACRFCGEEPYIPCPRDAAVVVKPQTSDDVATCTFDVAPKTRWMLDMTCTHGQLGCSADGIHVACRFCGEEPYVDCPEDAQHVDRESEVDTSSSCTFTVPPRTQSMWDTTCKHGDLGCNADNAHVECRFCGEEPYVACPGGQQGAPYASDNATSCTFTYEPKIASMWDPSCKHGETGCNADGLHVECRLCGEEPYVPCPETNAPLERCDFEDAPQINWMWDPTCQEGDIGCKADGVSTPCRFCGEGPYVECPKCDFQLEPEIPYVWDSKCEPLTYTNGCFADAIHFQCRFCGVQGFDPCPTTSTTRSTTLPTTTLQTSSSSASGLDESTVSTSLSSESSSTFAYDLISPGASQSLRGGGDAETSLCWSSTVPWALLAVLLGVV